MILLTSAVRCLISDVWCLLTVVCTSVCLSVSLSDIYLSDDWYLTSAVLCLLRCLLSVAWRLVISSVWCQLFIVWCLLFAVCIIFICCVCYLGAAAFCLMPLIWCWMPAVCMSFDNYGMLFLLSAVCCLMSLIWCRMSTVFCLLFDVCCLRVFWYILSAICYLLSDASYLMPDACCLISFACCPLSMSVVCMSHVWCLLHTCLISDVKWRGILPVIRPFISHRIFLSHKKSHSMKTGSIRVSG